MSQSITLQQERDKLHEALQTPGQLVGAERDSARRLINYYNAQLRKVRKLDDDLAERAFLRSRR